MTYYPVLPVKDHYSSIEIIDAVSKHLLFQLVRCLNSSGDACTYRSANGKLACAVGCLLTDEEVNTIKKNRVHVYGADYLAIHGMLPQRLIPHVELLLKLQSIHDGSSDSSTWELSLKEIRKEYGE